MSIRTVKANAAGMPQTEGTLDISEYNPHVAINRDTNRLLVDALGPKGQYISDNTPATGKWRFILAHKDSVLTTVTSSSITGTLTNVQLPAGFLWSGVFTALTMQTGGAITAYES